VRLGAVQPLGLASAARRRGRPVAAPGVVAGARPAAERAALAEIPEAGRAGLLLRCWVRKEALLKAIGEGPARDPREVPGSAPMWSGRVKGGSFPAFS
jgi:hypothetical protein